MSPVSLTLPQFAKKNVVKGKVSGVDVEILIDSGADYGMVPKSLVSKDAYCGEQCYISGVNKGTVLYELAEVYFELAGVKLRKKVIVDERDKPSPWCLLPLDLGDVGELQVYLNVLHGGNVSIMTHSQHRKEAALKNEKDVVIKTLESLKGVGKSSVVVVEDSTRSNSVNCNSEQVKSGSVDCEVRGNIIADKSIHIADEEAGSRTMPSRSMAEADGLMGGRVSMDSSEQVAGGGTEEMRLDPSVDEKVMDPSEDEKVGTVGVGGAAAHDSEVGAIPSATCIEDLVPGMRTDANSEFKQFVDGLEPVGSGSDKEKFREALLVDDSLKVWRELGERMERGFSWKRGLLVLSKFVAWEEHRDVLVVPRAFRGKILIVAHEKTGHLGGDKV